MNGGLSRPTSYLYIRVYRMVDEEPYRGWLDDAKLGYGTYFVRKEILK
jgi:hypothetical protein